MFNFITLKAALINIFLLTMGQMNMWGRSQRQAHRELSPDSAAPSGQKIVHAALKQ